MNPRRLFIRFVTPLLWKLSPDRRLQAIQEFSLIEKDSGQQIVAAMDFISDPRARASLFQHFLEELHHADLFAGALSEISSLPVPETMITRAPLLPEGVTGGKEAILASLAYFYAGERDINRDFGAYARGNAGSHLAEVFERVSLDEGRHEQDMIGLLAKASGSERSETARAVLYASLKRKWRTYVALMRKIGELQLHVVLSAVYFVLGGFFQFSLKRRLGMSGNQQLELFREQAEVAARTIERALT
jgi:hypothetical protein